jgi:hypothetical protein
MKLSVLSLIILSSLVAAIPAPQRKNGGNRGRPTAAVATAAAATPAAATSAVAAVPAPAVSSKASVAAPAPAVSTKASAAVGTSAGAGAGTAAGGAAGTAAGTAAGGAAGTAAAGTAAAGTAPAGTAPAGTAPSGTAPAGTAAAGSGHLITVCPLNLPRRPDETPQLTLFQVNNNCGSGTIKWQRQGVPQSVFPGGSTTVSGDITAAILWLDGYNGFACGANALNCGMVEFTLGPNGGFNSINYSLLTEGLGNHKLYVTSCPPFIRR